MPEEPDHAKSEVIRRRELRHHPIAAQRERNAQLREQAEQIVRSLTVPDAALPMVLAMVPANTRETTALPAETRKSFLDRLATTIYGVFHAERTAALPSGATREAMAIAESEVADSPAMSAVLGRSCATCRGECCTAGGDHAFLRDDSIERVHRDSPKLDAEAMLAQYADYLPARHYRGSCVYHARDGCTLPRDLRSNLCNRYVCGGLTQLRSALSGNASPSAFVAAADSAHLRRMSLVDETEMRPIALN